MAATARFLDFDSDAATIISQQTSRNPFKLRPLPMTFPGKRVSFYLAAVALGAGVFGGMWLPNALASTLYCNPSGTATVCYQHTTYKNVAPATQASYLAHGGTCGECGKPPTSPVSGPP